MQRIAIDITIVGQQFIIKNTIFSNGKTVVDGDWIVVDRTNNNIDRCLGSSAVAVSHFIGERIRTEKVPIRRVGKRPVSVKDDGTVSWVNDRRGIDLQRIAIDITIVGQQFIIKNTIFSNGETVVDGDWSVVD